MEKDYKSYILARRLFLPRKDQCLRRDLRKPENKTKLKIKH